MTARDGSFVFRDVTEGVYLLEVLSPLFHYSAMKIKVDDKIGIIAIEYKVCGGVYTFVRARVFHFMCILRVWCDAEVVAHGVVVVIGAPTCADGTLDCPC